MITNKFISFKSTHDLKFLHRPWAISYMISHEIQMQEFKIGTVHGLYRIDNKKRYLVINSVINDDPGNGHFKDLMEWLEFNCSELKYSLVFEEIFNPKMKLILFHYGFNVLSSNEMIKKYKSTGFKTS